MKLKKLPNSAQRIWNIVFYNDGIENLDFLLFIMRNFFKKDDADINLILFKFIENKQVIVASYIQEIALSIKHNLEIMININQANLRVQIEPEE